MRITNHQGKKAFHYAWTLVLSLVLALAYGSTVYLAIQAAPPAPELISRGEASWTEARLPVGFLFRYPDWIGWVKAENKLHDPYVGAYRAGLYATSCGRWEQVGEYWGLQMTWDTGCQGGTWFSGGIYTFALPTEPQPTTPPVTEPIITPPATVPPATTLPVTEGPTTPPTVKPTEAPTEQPTAEPGAMPARWTIYCGGVGPLEQAIYHVEPNYDRLVVSVPWSWCEDAWRAGPMRMLEKLEE